MTRKGVAVLVSVAYSKDSSRVEYVDAYLMALRFLSLESPMY